MMAKTFDSQTARFLAAVATCMPSLQGDVMQGWIDNPNALKKTLAGAFCPPQIKKSNAYLLGFYFGEDIILDPTDGTKTIAQAKNVFAYEISTDFVNWSLDTPARPTERVEVVIHELVADGTFAGIYESLGRPLAELCFTQAQIICFCMKHKNKLRGDRRGTFFLFERDGEFFVARVGMNFDGRLNAFVLRFTEAHVWRAGYHHRFVLPQLESSVASAS